jgi:WD40 repeat protein
VITGAGPREVRLKPGQYEVQATKGGQLVKQELVTIERGGRQVVKVGLEPPVTPPATAARTTPPQPSLYEVRRYVGHTAGVQDLCLSPDGTRILSASEDRTLRLWNLKTGAELRSFEGHTNCVMGAAFLRDGKRLVSGSWDRTVRVWDAETGKELQKLAGHGDGVWAGVAVLPDGKHIVSGSADETLRVWDIDSGKEVRKLQLDQPIHSVAVSADGRYALCGGAAGHVQLWDLDKGSLVRRLQGHGAWIRNVAFSPDGRRGLSAGGNDSTARLWDLQTGRELRRFEGHGGWAHSVAFSPDGSYALTGGQAVMFLWDLKTGSKLQTFRAGCEFMEVAFTHDSRYAVSANLGGGGTNNLLRLWELPYRLWPKAALSERLEQLSQSIQSNPGDAQLPEYRARLYGHLGRNDEAARDFIRANELLAPHRGWDPRSGLFESLMQHEAVFTRIAERFPEDATLWAQRGVYHALRSRWKAALDDSARAYALSRYSPWLGAQYASMLLLHGDEDGYRRVCVEMVGWLEQSDKYQLALTCSLGPRSGVDPARIIEWARSVSTAQDHRPMAWGLYRAGRFEEAVTLLQQGMEGGGLRSMAAFPLALAYHGLGQREDSRKWYENGVTDLKRATPRDPDDRAPWEISHWMWVNIWHREAKAVFEPPEKPAPPTECAAPNAAPAEKKASDRRANK